MALNALPKKFHADFRNKGMYDKPLGLVSIDYDNALTDSLTGVFLFRPDNIYKNLVPNGYDISPTSGARLAPESGDALVDDGVNYALEINKEIVSSGTTFDTDFTFFAVVDLRKPSVGNDDQFMLMANPISISNDVPLYFDNTGTNAKLASFTQSGSKITVTTPEPSVVVGEFDTVASTFVASSNLRTMYINGGNLVAGGGEVNTATNAYITPFANDAVHLFADGAQTARRLSASVKAILFFRRTLSAEEIAQLHKDPYQILRPSGPMVYFTPSGAAPTGRIMSSLANGGGLAGRGGIAGAGGGLAG